MKVSDRTSLAHDVQIMPVLMLGIIFLLPACVVLIVRSRKLLRKRRYARFPKKEVAEPRTHVDDDDDYSELGVHSELGLMASHDRRMADADEVLKAASKIIEAGSESGRHHRMWQAPPTP